MIKLFSSNIKRRAKHVHVDDVNSWTNSMMRTAGLVQ
jgi:hypothetical protein